MLWKALIFWMADRTEPSGDPALLPLSVFPSRTCFSPLHCKKVGFFVTLILQPQFFLLLGNVCSSQSCFIEERVIVNGKVKEREVNWLLCLNPSWHLSHFYFPLHYKAGINQNKLP